MTAWMLYQLKDDEEASKVFIGEDAELLNNKNWQDVEKKNNRKIKILGKCKNSPFLYYNVTRD